MRVSIVNCVSTAADMMRYSDESLFSNAGHQDFTYIIVKWLASLEVEEYLIELQKRRSKQVYVIEHKTNPQIGYVPNLRAMMNEGFEEGFRRNAFAGLTNTDVYHGPGWLDGLVRYACEDTCVSSLHITAVPLNLMNYPKYAIVNEDLGIPEPGKFKSERFQEIYNALYKDRLVWAWETAAQGGLGGWRQVHTMPYLFHRKWWNKLGGWPLTFDWRNEAPSPDEVFFSRLEGLGCKFAVSLASIIYHAEGIERKRVRPLGAEQLEEE